MRAIYCFPLLFVSWPALSAVQDAAVSYLDAIQVIFSLFAILALIYFLSAFFRKTNLVQARGNNVIKVLASLALGNKERLLLVQVGEEQILLSTGSSGINKIHSLKKQIQPQDSTQAAWGEDRNFSSMLGKVLGGRGNGNEGKSS